MQNYTKQRLTGKSFFLASVVGALAMTLCGGCLHGGDSVIVKAASLSPDSPFAENVFDTTADNQAATFRNLDKIEATRVIAHRGAPSPLLPSPLKAKVSVLDDFIDDHMIDHRVAGLLILKDGKIVVERYGMGNDAASKWTTFSIAKSFMATMVGTAIHDGRLKLTDRADKHLPRLKGTAYGETTISDLLRMTSGIRWKDTAAEGGNLLPLLQAARLHRRGAVLDYLATLDHDALVMNAFNYNSGNSHVLAEIVQAVTGTDLNVYLSHKVWEPAGMESDGYWWAETKHDGIEFGGGGISATLRDYGRFGNFILKGALNNGRSVLPEDWARQAYKPQDVYGTRYGEILDLGFDKRIGYGYHWWVSNPELTNRPKDKPIFHAYGIFGQYIFIDRETKTVVVVLSAWREPDNYNSEQATLAFIREVQEVLH